MLCEHNNIIYKCRYCEKISTNQYLHKKRKLTETPIEEIKNILTDTQTVLAELKNDLIDKVNTTEKLDKIDLNLQLLNDKIKNLK